MNNQVLAIVAGREITRNHMDELKMQLGQQAANFNNAEGESKLLEELIHQELFYSEAVDQNIDQEQAYLAEVELEKANLLKRYAIRKILAEVVVSEEELEAFYNDNPKSFEREPGIRARHILMPSLEIAEGVATEIRGGRDFADAALAFSMCPSKEQGGDLGTFGKGQMVPEFETAAFDLEIGVLSDPVETQFGFHLIEVLEKEMVGKRSLDEVRLELHRELTMRKQSQHYMKHVEALKSLYPIERK